MSGKVTVRKRKKLGDSRERRYDCNAKQAENPEATCNASIRADPVDEAVWGQILSWVLSLSTLKSELAALRKHTEAARGQLKKDQESLRGRLLQTDQKLAKVLELYLDEKFDQVTLERKQRELLEMKTQEEGLARIDAALAEGGFSPEEINSFLRLAKTIGQDIKLSGNPDLRLSGG